MLESNVDTKPTTITLYEITKALNFPSIGTSDTHRINKNKFNDFLVDNDTDKIPNEYVKSTSQLDDKKLDNLELKITEIIFMFLEVIVIYFCKQRNHWNCFRKYVSHNFNRCK